MPKITVSGGASNATAPVPADMNETVTIGQLIKFMGQLGFPAVVGGTAASEGPSFTSASTTLDLAGSFAGASLSRPTLGGATKAVGMITAPGTPRILRWASLGDSVAYLKFRWMIATLTRAYGQTQYFAPGTCIETGQNGTGWSIPGNTITTVSGTVVNATSDFDIWFSGKTERFATSAVRTYGIGGVNATWDSATVYYAKGSGALDAGTFKIQIDGIDEAGFTNISCVAGSPNLGIATITRGSAAQRGLGVINLTGAHRIIGVGFENSTASGVIPAGIAQGGISATSAVGSVGARTALDTWLRYWRPDVLTLEMKETSLDWATNLAILLPILVAACPAATIIGIGSTPVNGSDPDQVIQNSQLKAACAAYGVTYWDGYTPLVNYPTMVAYGWQGDGTHPDDKANAYLAGLLLSDMKLLLHPGVFAPRDVNAVNVYAGKLGVGTLSPTKNLDIAVQGNAALLIKSTSPLSGQPCEILLQSGFSGTNGNAVIGAYNTELRADTGTVGGGNLIFTVWVNGGERLRINASGQVILGGGPMWAKGTGSPEAVITAPIGSFYNRTDGGAATSLYVKESGAGNTGWVAK